MADPCHRQPFVTGICQQSLSISEVSPHVNSSGSARPLKQQVSFLIVGGFNRTKDEGGCRAWQGFLTHESTVTGGLAGPRGSCTYKLETKCSRNGQRIRPPSLQHMLRWDEADRSLGQPVLLGIGWCWRDGLSEPLCGQWVSHGQGINMGY